MFNRSRALLGAALASAGLMLSTAFAWKAPQLKLAPVEFFGKRQAGMTVARAKRAALKRRNQQRHKRACRG